MTEFICCCLVCLSVRCTCSGICCITVTVLGCVLMCLSYDERQGDEIVSASQASTTANSTTTGGDDSDENLPSDDDDDDEDDNADDEAVRKQANVSDVIAH